MIIKLKNIRKDFNIVHEKVDSLKSMIINPIGIFRQSKEKISVLKDIDINIKKGEFIGLIGKNGSGKSTLLKIIAGIYSPDGGTVEVNGNLVPFLELGVGFNPDLSARENIYLNGTILGMTRKFLKSKFQEIIDFAEIHEFVDTPVKNFSSGMLVRLAFAIAIQSDADIYLLDEVMSVGDVAFQEKSLAILNKFKDQGKTIILVSHNMNAIAKFAKRLIYIKDGRVESDGDPQEVIRRYLHDSFGGDSLDGDTRWGTGEVKIQKVQLKNSKGKKESVFSTGEEIIIDIEYNIEKQVKELNVGVGIYDSETNYYVFGRNTTMKHQNSPVYANQRHQIHVDHKAPTGKNSKNQKIVKSEGRTGTVDLVIKKPNLLRGSYYINVVLFGNNEKKAYDFVRVPTNIHIHSDSEYRGNLDLEHEWRISYQVPAASEELG